MLFYSQIKRKFTQSSWKHGQTYFWEDRIKSVRLEGTKVLAQVVDAKPHDTNISIQRGTFSDSLCSCPEHESQKICKHVAALCIWVVEKGSLLRAGVTEPQKVLKSKDLTLAEPVVFVRPIFENKVFSGITLEPALRYMHPQTKQIYVESIYSLVEQDPISEFSSSFYVWKNYKGLYLKTTHEAIPLLGTLHASRLTHEGTANGLENLFLLLSLENKTRVVFHESLNLEACQEPLKLTSLHVGKKIESGRVLSYEFKNSKIMLDSEKIASLSEKGLVSSQYIWPADIQNQIFKFDIPLSMLVRYANRTGAVQEEHKKYVPDGYTFLEEDANHPLHPLAVYRLSLELGVSQFTVDSDWTEFQEWKKNFEIARSPMLPKVSYGFDLREYQTNGLSWLWSLYHRGLAALLADEMGLGKTHQVLALLTSLYVKHSKHRPPTLVVAPTSVVAAWVQKLQKYDTGLKWQVFHGKKRSLENSQAHLVLTTYGILQKESILRQKQWEVIVLDEAQAIKNATTISSRASRILRSKFKIAMTGTPIENQSTDLWSVIEFLLPGFLGPLPRFKRLYGSGRETPSQVQAQALKRLITPFLLRRTKSQVLKELPEKTEEVVLCSLTASQQKLYQEVLNSSEANKLRSELRTEGGKIDYAGILAILTKLKQVCDHPKLPAITSGRVKKIKTVNPMDSGKWESFEEIINEALGSNLKVVVFTQYLGMIDLISHWLETKGIEYTQLRGSTIDRATPLQVFAQNPNCKIFLCSLLAGGLGIDLTAASVCIHFDRWWNPAKENQATDRLHRIGQTRGVQVFKLQSPDTIEERIAMIIESKISLSQTLIEESPLGLKSFSRKELLDLLMPK